jgi:hypothetical protein
MTPFLILLFSCEQQKLEPKIYADLLNSGNCHPNDSECLIEECSEFFTTQHPADIFSEQSALLKLCTRLDEKNSPVYQSCGLPACFALPVLYPEGAMQILQDGVPLHASQRIARQTIIRGLIEYDLFTSFLEEAKYSEKWLNIAVSESLCEESSSAKQLSLTCQESNPQAAQAAWALSDTHPPDSTSHRSALNLAIILDTKGMAAMLLSLLLDENMDIQKRSSAAQAIHFAKFRGYKVKPEFQALIDVQCQAGDPPLKLLCL